jgi:hypothetical protein
MNAKQLHDKLIELDACEEARVWAEGKSLAKAWNTCERGDWMLWLAGRLCDRKIVVLAACDCAELSLKHVPEGEDRPRKAIETARAWVRGEATLAQLKKAAAAAYAASYAAAYAAYAAYGYAADAAAAAAAAAYAASADAAAAAAAYAAAYAAYAAYAAREGMLKQCAKLVRRRIPRIVIGKDREGTA